MSLTLAQTQAVADLAEYLAEYLPGKPHPYADQSISFLGVAKRVGVAKYWPTAGSKTPSVRTLLLGTLGENPKRFCTLILEIVRVGIGYRQNKNPISREDIERLDALVRRVGFGIKDLGDPAFLGSLPTEGPRSPARPKPSESPTAGSLAPTILASLKSGFDDLFALAPVVRGFAFEDFLGRMFEAYSLAPRSAFRLTGEQIDGSFDLNGQPYLLEAKWQSKPLGQSDLLVFSGKVAGKAQWSRGVLVSYSGFSSEGLKAFGVGKPTNIVCLDRADLTFVLLGKAPLPDLLRRKVRRAAEENTAFVPAPALFS
jgi:hypothetical protein